MLTDRGGGQVRAVWLCRYDPVSTAFFGDAAGSLQGCELVVVQHLFLTETARFAHVVLPTTAFGEERVTFTSTERRIQLAEQVIEPLPGTTPAWQQLTRVAQALGAAWKYDSAADVMAEIAEVVPFYSGASYQNLARDYGRQWPCTRERPLGTKFLFDERPGERGFKFVPPDRSADASSASSVSAETRRRGVRAPSADYPFTLVFGNSLYYWHRNTLIQHSETLKREYRILLLDYPEGFVEVNAEDAKQLGLRDGEKIRLRAAGGSAVAAARVTPEVRRGAIFVPYFVRQVQQQVRGSTQPDRQFVPVRVEKEAA